MQKIKFALIILLLAILPGCVTQRRCNLKYPSGNDTIRITHTRDSIVFKDTTIYIPIPGEIRIDSVSIPCPPPKASYIPDTAYAKTSLAEARAWWHYPYIRLELIQKDTTIEKRLDNAIKEAYRWQSEYEKIVQVKETKYVPKIYKDALSICIVIFALAFAFAGWKLYGFFKK